MSAVYLVGHDLPACMTARKLLVDRLATARGPGVTVRG